MIRVLGPDGTDEFEAAVHLRREIVRVWPSVADDTASDVWIIAGAKCHGQDVQDIDLLLLADLGDGGSFQPLFPFTARSGQLQHPDRIVVRSLCLAIEVKGHSPDGVRFVGATVDVRYPRGWDHVSEKVLKQVHAVKRYIEVGGLQAPWIVGLIWLTDVPSTILPNRPHNIVGRGVTWETLLSVVVQSAPSSLRWMAGTWVLDASRGGDHAAVTKVADLFGRVIVPTRLDRLRVERLTSRAIEASPVGTTAGSKLTLLRGRGGTGKTVRLLELAHRLSRAEDARVLILTYNKALVADVRRLLTIMGIAPSFAESTIQIQSVHAFFLAAMRDLGFAVGPGVNALDAYERLKAEALEYVGAGALSADDIARLASAGHQTFWWDYVFVDEGQDWPQDERELLFALFPPSRVVVADGIDQLVRSNVPTDWRGSLARRQVEVVELARCLRMKAGLARFASAVARNLGLLYSGWQPNDDVPGGRVVVVDGPYLADRALHDQLMQANALDKNAPIDVLACVPPALVDHGGPAPGPRSVPAAIFARWGYKVWDGASEDVREGYPTANDQIRIVQYDSCRGLEGWTSVNLALDRFYEHKRALASAASATNPDLEAARWIGIPLSRAIDTLVIQLDLPQSPLRDAVTAASRECADIVQWIEPLAR